MKTPLFSTSVQLSEIATALRCNMRLPLSPKTIPGALLEALIAHVHNAEVLDTYDFVDVIQRSQRVGWQVKSTKEETPVTWKRAKIPNKDALVAASMKRKSGLQPLGDAIIAFCNEHAEESFAAYPLDAIGFSRVILHPDNRVTYFERLLCTRENPQVFVPSEFTWRWTLQKKTTGKEQKPALHGIHRESGRKWFAAHILGENQLHFAGESAWWPKPGSPHAITFNLPAPSERLSLVELIALLERRDSAS
jgi:hypothetical protein